MAKLNGQILIRAQVNPQTGATRFEFDLGGLLEVRRFERDSEDDLWILYKPNGYVLAVKGGGQHSHQLGKRLEEKLRPIKAPA